MRLRWFLIILSDTALDRNDEFNFQTVGYDSLEAGRLCSLPTRNPVQEECESLSQGMPPRGNPGTSGRCGCSCSPSPSSTP